MRFWLTGCLIIAAFAEAHATPFDPSVVAADAKWYVHFDADLARESKVIGQMREHMLGHEHAKKRLDELKQKLGFDPAKDLHGITYFRIEDEPQSGILIIKADADRQRVASELKQKPDIETTSHDGVEIYSWTDADLKDLGMEVVRTPTIGAKNTTTQNMMVLKKRKTPTRKQTMPNTRAIIIHNTNEKSWLPLPRIHSTSSDPRSRRSKLLSM